MSRELLRSSTISKACLQCQFRSFLPRTFTSPFSSTSRRRAENDAASSTATANKAADQSTKKTSASDATSDLADLSKFFGIGGAKRIGGQSQNSFSSLTSSTFNYDTSPLNPANRALPEHQPPHHFHIFATKHNTHITLTKPNRDAILSVSCGNLGFRKANRGNYDSAYQLAAFVLKQIQERGLLSDIKKLEVVLRNFGPGREAVTKALMGNEGRLLRGKIVRITDATRLKFGGTRSPKPRRLG
ncbi:translational machinery component [Xylona heveae TC161]|uniref:Small ribosomal subunit protein uS11m n=1 Tax=Xylona heveae (strain CBS 132557 / TC161) TaxID=1328760 RepID=A0A164Z8H3_XYLHT|nr:translational machinery component [Xylona heveae TC161]KZF18816.1 translational machinery component [Xylona heveae TC161]